jgi:SpoIVB peptidase S55
LTLRSHLLNIVGMRGFGFPFLVVAAVLASSSPAARASEILPLDQVRPGMKGVGRTVFEGTRIDEFSVEIIGVLDNIGPKQNLILARLTGGPLANTGVIAGMSGSPVFVDGKLVGAVSYGFPFSKETIAGITPIGEMIELTRTAADAPRAASARFPRPSGGLQAPLDRATLISALQRPMRQVSLRGAALREGVLPTLAESAMRPLALPLLFSGFDAATFEWARDLFAGLGFAPVMGGGGGGADRLPGPLPDLAPGGPIGVTLLEGDFDVSVTGTITHIDQGRVYAFGHPFYNLGPTQFPMRKAYVYSVFPSLYQSWKISVPGGEPVGTIEQDRNTAIAGRLGPPPRMIPVEVKLDTSRGQDRSFSFRMVEDELFSPVLAFVALTSVLQANERNYGTSTIQVDAKLTLSDGREVRVDDLFTQEQPAIQASALVAAPLAYLMSNDFEKVRVERLDVSASSLETIQTAQIQRAWIERTGPVRPGTVVPLRVLLRTYRGEIKSETVPIPIPANAPAGTYSVLVADGVALSQIEQREMRQAFEPRDLDQLIRAINGLRKASHLYVRLLRPDEGAIVSGEYFQSLPPSVLSVLGASGESSVVPLRTASVWEFDLPTDYALSGNRLLPLTVER